MGVHQLPYRAKKDIKAPVKPSKNIIQGTKQANHGNIALGPEGIYVHLVPVYLEPGQAEQGGIHPQKHHAQKEEHCLPFLLAVISHGNLSSKAIKFYLIIPRIPQNARYTSFLKISLAFLIFFKDSARNLAFFVEVCYALPKGGIANGL